MEVTGYPQGAPCWFELSTTDEGAALRFYSAVFGWTDNPQPMGEGMGSYHQQQLRGLNVAAISAQQPEEAQQGIPPHWSVYLAVTDVDAVARKVGPAGGQVIMEPLDVMEHGRMALIADPTGGMVGLWQARAHTGAQLIREPNTISWAELMTRDAPRATAFFEQVLGVTSQVAPMEGGAPYTLLRANGQDAAGVMTMTPEMGQMPVVWGIYFEVDDTDRCVARAQELGATVLQPPTDIMPGRFAMLQDPQGAVFGVIKSNPPA
jgi:predicted enzyme related to lactoylglutathione lyase